MACATSDMIHTSGDGALVMCTGALEPGPLIGLLKSTDGGKGARYPCITRIL